MFEVLDCCVFQRRLSVRAMSSCVPTTRVSSWTSTVTVRKIATTPVTSRQTAVSTGGFSITTLTQHFKCALALFLVRHNIHRNRTPHTLNSPYDVHHSVNLSNMKFIP